MAEFQNKANDLHSYIREIESKEKNYRKFKVLAAVLTLVLTLGIVTWVWILPQSLSQFFDLSAFTRSQIVYQTFDKENLNLSEAQRVLKIRNNFVLIHSPEEDLVDTIYTRAQLSQYIRTHNLDTSQLSEDLAENGERFAYTKVDQMPYFPGGKQALAQYLQSKLVYPQDARTNQVEGNVQVRFIILPDGSIDEVTVINGIGYGCDEEAKRLVSEMPDWIPGEQEGELVPVYKALAIKFQLL